MLRTVRRLLVLTAAIILTATAAAQRYEWRDVVQNVTINADGSVIIDDTRTLWTDGEFVEAFICVEHVLGQQFTLLKGTGTVGSGPGAVPYTQACEDGAIGTEMVILIDGSVSERRVRFRYELRGTLDTYADVVQWYWNPLETGHPGVVNYDLTVTAPGPMVAPFDAFVHRYDNPEHPNVSHSPDRAKLGVHLDQIPSGDGVEIRYLMDPGLFDIKGEGTALVGLLRDELRIAETGFAAGGGSHRVTSADDVNPSMLYSHNEDVRLPDGTARVASWLCAELATEPLGTGIVDCFYAQADPLMYATAFEVALYLAGYQVVERTGEVQGILTLRLEHPTGNHTLILMLSGFQEPDEAYAMLLMYPSH